MATEAELKRRLERAGTLLEALRELQAKTYQLTEELQSLVRGEAITGDHLRLLEGIWSDEYERRYGSKYMFDFKKDRLHWKRLLKAVGPDELVRRVTAYFHEADDYTRRAKHPFGLFVARFNSLAEARTTLPMSAAPVIACHHEPPCTSDAEHTRRRSEDVKRGQA